VDAALGCPGPGACSLRRSPPTPAAGKYDMTAVAMIALLKYGRAMPFSRMERLETQFGFHYRSHSMGVDGAGRGFAGTDTGRVDPAGGAGQRGSQR
jgi:hypothetical protein